ncbi:tol-pal system YbgF family protein [Streptomyces sp. PSAA01]|uniref:tetratricopeptide repeat protein n=1 Tax=Streptomyces sp. PSAA01 TaxID=2912762 RepID=UPI001F43EC35|nr:tetratricopeptide repeat protein [Streptomyces sp. PSAA01]MCG0288164.1 tetratricopeptide repeat protein [Streptomyces sp. PSAA01]
MPTLAPLDQERPVGTTLCEKALALFRRHGDRHGEAATLDSLGYIAHHSGSHRQALDHYRQALTIRRDTGNAHQEADTLVRLGETHHALGRQIEACHAWQQAAEKYGAQGRYEEVRLQLDALGAETA